ncbi:hypothetical protein F4808DRAFT_475344 [Astrocystis sublimbata]|nr:hypothetical protein F4808DRAFT_475344 [Astrocystis sublimbata]
MESTNQAYPTRSPTAAQGVGAGEAALLRHEQHPEMRWTDQDCGGLEVLRDPKEGIEVIRDPREGIEVHYANDIEVDHRHNLRASPILPPEANGLKFPNTGPDPVGGEKPGLIQNRRVCGLKRPWFWALIALLGFVIVGAAVGAGVGSTVGHHAATGNGTTVTISSPILQNSSKAASQWRDPGTNNSQYRVYVQSEEGSILEVAWSSNDTVWTVSKVTDDSNDVALGTPITTDVGYPHANTSMPFVKNVYIVGQTGSITERESPYKEQARHWGDENFTGLDTASAGSSILCFWYQSFVTETQILTVLYQDQEANSIQVARYTANETHNDPWLTTKQEVQIQNGSALAAAPVGSRNDLRLHKLQLAVSTQDNRNYFAPGTLPDCASGDNPQELTHLILFPSVDRSSLNLVSWNCSSGFLDQTTSIEPVLQQNRTYLGLANTLSSLDPEDQRVYVLFDAGGGPEIEEWQVPPGAQNADWKVLGTVPVAIT